MNSTQINIQTEAIFRVVEGDCVEAALVLKEEGYNPAVLNMANGLTRQKLF